MPNTRYDLVRLKVERARQHVRETEAAIGAFFNTHPHAVRAEPQMYGTVPGVSYRLASMGEVPKSVVMAAADAIHNLRSALDHLVHQLVRTAGGTPNRKTGFPVFDDEPTYRQLSPRKLRGLTKEAVAAVDALRPYKGGNDGLWELHTLNNIDKHHQWLVLGSAMSFVRFPTPQQPLTPEYMRGKEKPGPVFHGHVPKVTPLKLGDLLLADLGTTQFKPNLRFGFEIAISEVHFGECRALIPMLHRMADLVGHVVFTFAPLLR